MVLVPLILIFIALSTRYLTHPRAFDTLSPSRSSPWTTVQDWTPHKRHAAPDPLPATSSGIATTVQNTRPTGSSLSVAAAASAAPTTVNPGNTKVPSAPPVLPTPFPQAFDSTFSTSFQTVACQNFMTNMTQTAAFRECRPFSLLVGDSNAFITVSLFDLRVFSWDRGPAVHGSCASAGPALPLHPIYRLISWLGPWTLFCALVCWVRRPPGELVLAIFLCPGALPVTWASLFSDVFVAEVSVCHRPLLEFCQSGRTGQALWVSRVAQIPLPLQLTSLLALTGKAYVLTCCCRFKQSQRNISALNVIIWGTCNTDLSAVQCASNMQWFARTIQSACKQDIAAKNSIVTDAVAGPSPLSRHPPRHLLADRGQY